MSTITRTSDYYKYITQAWHAPKATKESRLALVAYQLGLPKADLKPFDFLRRKGSKTIHFDYDRFAEKYGISIDWLWHGYLPEHPRNLKPIKRGSRADDVAWLAAHPRRRSNSVALARSREFKEAMRQRIREVAASCNLSDEAIKAVLKLKHQEVGRFSEEHRINLGWLLDGIGPMFKSGKPQ